MKRIFLLIAFFGAILTAQAQIPSTGSTIKGRISGTIIDSLTKKPVDYATISLSRSGGKAILNGTLTDEKGNFKINDVAPGNYKLSITFIGYPTKIIDPVTTTPGKPDNNIGNVVIAPSAKTLSAVTITGQTPIIETKIDKIVYNAEKDVTSAGGNATDVLRKVPLVSVDLDGKPSLRGDANVRVLINGKPSGALSTSLADVLRTIPADQIKSIEVITSPSAKYDAEGSGGIINIITKSKNVSGLSGSISGGVGTRQNNGNANINYKQNRFSIGANLGSNFAWPQTSLVDLRNTSTGKLPDGTTGQIRRIQSSAAETKRSGTIGSVTTGYDFNDFNSITSTIRINGGGFKTDGNTYNTNNSLLDTIYNSRNLSKATFSGFDWNADYTHKFKKEGEELTVAGQWSHSKITSDFESSFTDLNNLTDIAKFPNQRGNNNGTNDEYTAQADYTLPLSKIVKLEAGGKGIFRRISSVYDIANQANNNTGDFIKNTNLSNDYDYSQDVYAGYTVLSFTLPKNYALQTGLRVENTDIVGTPKNLNQPGLQSFPQNYTNFVPSFVLSKTVNSTQTYKLSYNKRIQRPSLTYLNPFINKANPDNQTQGKPDLRPEVAQTIELGYNTFIKSSIINVSVYYKRTSDLIEGIADTLTDPELKRRVTRTTYQNVGKNNSFGASFFGSVTPWKPLTIRGSINGFTYSPNANSAQQAQQTSTGTYFQYNAFGQASLTLNHGFTAEAFGVFNSPRRTIQGNNPSFSLIGFGFKKDVIAKKFTLGLTALSPFQKYLKFDQDISGQGFSQTQKIRYPLQSFGLTFTYNFGKLNYGTQATKKKGVKNDDLLQGGDQTGGAPAGGGTTGGPR